LVDQTADFSEAGLVFRIKALLRERINKAVGDFGQLLHAISGRLQSVFAGSETDITDADLHAAECCLCRQRVTENSDLEPADRGRFPDVPAALPLQDHDRDDEHDRQTGSNGEFGSDAEVGRFKR
jgi:hypothetical protein